MLDYKAINTLSENVTLTVFPRKNSSANNMSKDIAGVQNLSLACSLIAIRNSSRARKAKFGWR
jgi:hypothetical protein